MREATKRPSTSTPKPTGRLNLLTSARKMRRGSKKSPWLYKVTMLVLATCSVALLTMSVIISNAIQSASVLEGKQVHASRSLRRPGGGGRSHQMNGLQNQRQGNLSNAMQTPGPGAVPSHPRDERVQQLKLVQAALEMQRAMDSGRIPDSEIYQPDNTTGRRLVTYKRYGGRLVRHLFILSDIAMILLFNSYLRQNNQLFQFVGALQHAKVLKRTLVVPDEKSDFEW